MSPSPKRNGNGNNGKKPNLSGGPRRRSPNSNGNTTVRGLMQYARSNFRKAASAAKVQFIVLGMTATSAALIVKKMIDSYDERYNEPGRKYNRNFAEFKRAEKQWNKECTVGGGLGGAAFKRGSGFRPVACPIRRPVEPNRPRVSLGSDITSLRKSVSIMNLAWVALIVFIINKIVVTVTSTWVSVQKGRLVGVAVGRAKNEAKHSGQIGQQTVNTAANFREISRPLLESAKDIAHAIAEIEKDMTKVIRTQGARAPNRARLEEDKKALENLLKSKIPLIEMSTIAQVEFQRMLNAPARLEYQRVLNETIQQTHQIAGDVSANLNTKGVGAAIQNVTRGAANLAKTAAGAYITGGGSLLLKGRQANQAPQPKAASPRLAIQAPRPNTNRTRLNAVRRRIEANQNAGGAGPGLNNLIREERRLAAAVGSPSRYPSPPRRLQIKPKTPSPPRRRSPSKSPNSRNVNKTLNTLLKQFN